MPRLHLLWTLVYPIAINWTAICFYQVHCCLFKCIPVPNVPPWFLLLAVLDMSSLTYSASQGSGEIWLSLLPDIVGILHLTTFCHLLLKLGTLISLCHKVFRCLESYLLLLNLQTITLSETESSALMF